MLEGSCCAAGFWRPWSGNAVVLFPIAALPVMRFPCLFWQTLRQMSECFGLFLIKANSYACLSWWSTEQWPIYASFFFFFCRSMNKNRGQWSAATLEMTSLCRDDSTVLAQNSQVLSKALKLEKANFNDDSIVWTRGGSITWADNRHKTENAKVKCSIVLFETMNIHNYCLAKSRWCNMVLIRAFLPFPKAVIGCNI